VLCDAARQTVTQCFSMVAFTHTLRCALIRCASKTQEAFLSAQRINAQRMCEQPITHSGTTGKE